MPKDRIRLVDYSAAAGLVFVHGLQGGGIGLGGRFIEATWCGISNGTPAWAHVRLTDAEATCPRCLRARRAASRSWRS